MNFYINPNDPATLKVRASKAITEAIEDKRLQFFGKGSYKYTAKTVLKKPDLSRAVEKHDKKLIFNHAIKKATTEAARKLELIENHIEQPGKELVKINSKNYVYK